MVVSPLNVLATNLSSRISIKEPGNKAMTYQLIDRDGRLLCPNTALPIDISKVTTSVDGGQIITITLKARQKVYYNLGLSLNTEIPTKVCDFYLPGFWYHMNLRSPDKAPSFHSSKSWNVREDRLSSPSTGTYDTSSGKSYAVLRLHDSSVDAIAPLPEGEVILSGQTSVGYAGFDNETGTALLTFGYPYIETPKRYTRKLTLNSPIFTFCKLEKDETKILSWMIHKGDYQDYGQFITNIWNLCYDTLKPTPIAPKYSPEEVKAQLTNYFRKSFISDKPLKFNSALSLRIDECKPVAEMEIGFCGRVLLNAFNEIEYGEEHAQEDLVDMGHSILSSFMANGFTPAGYIYDHLWYNKKDSYQDKHTIRQQSEAVYALLHYLHYENEHGRKHKDWEERIKNCSTIS